MNFTEYQRLALSSDKTGSPTDCGSSPSDGPSVNRPPLLERAAEGIRVSGENGLGTMDAMAWSPCKLARFDGVPAWSWGDLIVALEADRWRAYRRRSVYKGGPLAVRPLTDAGEGSAAWSPEQAQQWAEGTFKQRRLSG